MATGLFIGMMSGTSLDGVDTVLMDFNLGAGKMVASQFTPMPDTLRQSLAELCRSGVTTLENLGGIDHDLGELYAQCALSLLNTAQYKPEDIAAIGCHGQTVWHSPQGNSPFTMQIGDANIIAARTGVTTVADFRRKDMAFGGQGAPLVPAYHQVLFTVPNQLTVILNIGGISNISVLPPDANAFGYDTGPGNVLLDAWIEHHQGQRYDNNGTWAAQGRVHNALLTLLLQTPFFAQPAPKSTGRELFNLPWLQGKLAELPPIAPVDVQATLVELTARSIAEQIVALPDLFAKQSLLVCGGGAKNPQLMARLTDLLPDWQLGTTTASGLDIDYVEAAAFAWLAYQRLHNLPSNVPAVTGAKRAIPLGAIYPGESSRGG